MAERRGQRQAGDDPGRGPGLERVDRAQGGVVGGVTSNWTVVGTGDYNGDGKADILWRDSSSGNTGVWFMNGLQVSSTSGLGAIPLSWSVMSANAE